MIYFIENSNVSQILRENLFVLFGRMSQSINRTVSGGVVARVSGEPGATVALVGVDTLTHTGPSVVARVVATCVPCTEGQTRHQSHKYKGMKKILKFGSK